MKHIVGFSGGVDSQACALWVREHFPIEDVILMNSDAGGWEDPLTIGFIDWYSENIHPVVRTNAIVADMWRTPGFAETKGLDSNATLTFEEMVRIKGRPPSRKAQFCTEKLKLAPQRRWVEAQRAPGGLLEGGYVRYIGVRRDESQARKDTPSQAWDDWFDCELFYPVVDWTKQACFDYVIQHGEKVNPLYALGFNRVGCAPCINSSKADIMNWDTRRPEMIEKVRALEKSTGHTFFAPCVPGARGYNTIDEVLAWARSRRGHVGQEMFPMMYEREACESKYGLCE
jgi:3'-phosphoadenosine 5'-phosphosulfate sulfotransferase (PAPS reductase)/FAD synthetase